MSLEIFPKDAQALELTLTHKIKTTVGQMPQLDTLVIWEISNQMM
jgi:hypothetical protein